MDPRACVCQEESLGLIRVKVKAEKDESAGGSTWVPKPPNP